MVSILSKPSVRKTCVAIDCGKSCGKPAVYSLSCVEWWPGEIFVCLDHYENSFRKTIEDFVWARIKRL